MADGDTNRRARGNVRARVCTSASEQTRMEHSAIVPAAVDHLRLADVRLNVFRSTEEVGALMTSKDTTTLCKLPQEMLHQIFDRAVSNLTELKAVRDRSDERTTIKLYVSNGTEFKAWLMLLCILPFHDYAQKWLARNIHLAIDMSGHEHPYWKRHVDSGTFKLLPASLLEQFDRLHLTELTLIKFYLSPGVVIPFVGPSRPSDHPHPTAAAWTQINHLLRVSTVFHRGREDNGKAPLKDGHAGNTVNSKSSSGSQQEAFKKKAERWLVEYRKTRGDSHSAISAHDNLSQAIGIDSGAQGPNSRRFLFQHTSFESNRACHISYPQDVAHIGILAITSHVLQTYEYHGIRGYPSTTKGSRNCEFEGNRSDLRAHRKDYLALDHREMRHEFGMPGLGCAQHVMDEGVPEAYVMAGPRWQPDVHTSKWLPEADGGDLPLST